MYGYHLRNVKNMQYNCISRHSAYLVDKCELRVRFDWVTCEKFAIGNWYSEKKTLSLTNLSPSCRLIRYFPEIVHTIGFFMSKLSSVILAKNRQPETLWCRTISFLQLHKIWTIFLGFYHIHIHHHIHKYHWNIKKNRLLLLVIFINNHQHPIKSLNLRNFTKHSISHCSLSSSTAMDKRENHHFEVTFD